MAVWSSDRKLANTLCLAYPWVRRHLRIDASGDEAAPAAEGDTSPPRPGQLATSSPQNVQVNICALLRCCAWVELPGEKAARAGAAAVTVSATSDGGQGTPRGLAPHSRAAGSIIMSSWS